MVGGGSVIGSREALAGKRLVWYRIRYAQVGGPCSKRGNGSLRQSCS